MVNSKHPDIVLIFPPHCDPRAPYLALPSLSAFLRKEGYTVVLKDVNLEALSHFLEPDFLSIAYKKLKIKLKQFYTKKGQSYAEFKALRKIKWLIASAPLLIKNIENIKNIFHSEDFYNINKYKAARLMLDDALALVSASYDTEIDYSIKEPEPVYKVRYNSYILSDLIKAVSDRYTNIFIDYFKHHTLKEIIGLNSKLIGISIANMPQIIPGLTLAYMLKREGFYVTIGGSYFTKFIPEIKNSKEFFKFCDSIVVFEGEHALMELVKQLKSSSPDFSKVPNLIYSQNGRVKMNEPIYVEDPNKLPTPDFDGLPLEKYFIPRPVLPLALGKGCHWNECRFCNIPFSSNFFDKAKYRLRNLDLVIADLKTLSHKYDTNYFFFTNECIPSKYLYQFAKKIRKAKLYINYSCYARIEPDFNNRVCREIVLSGAKKMRFGLESVYQKTLNFINKDYHISNVKKVLKNCHKNGLAFHLTLIVGFPMETEVEAKRIISFFKQNRRTIEHPFNTVFLNLFSLNKHSFFYDCHNQSGIIKIRLKKNQREIFCDSDFSFRTKTGMKRKQAIITHKYIISELAKHFHCLMQSGKNYIPGLQEYDVLYIEHHLPR